MISFYKDIQGAKCNGNSGSSFSPFHNLKVERGLVPFRCGHVGPVSHNPDKGDWKQAAHLAGDFVALRCFSNGIVSDGLKHGLTNGVPRGDCNAHIVFRRIASLVFEMLAQHFFSNSQASCSRVQHRIYPYPECGRVPNIPKVVFKGEFCAIRTVSKIVGRKDLNNYPRPVADEYGSFSDVSLPLTKSYLLFASFPEFRSGNPERQREYGYGDTGKGSDSSIVLISSGSGADDVKLQPDDRFDEEGAFIMKGLVGFVIFALMFALLERCGRK